MNYSEEGELWYFSGACVSSTAQVCAVTHGTVTKDEDKVKQKPTAATRFSPTNTRNKIGSSNNNINKRKTPRNDEVKQKKPNKQKIK
jgi:hypothetical protein